MKAARIVAWLLALSLLFVSFPVFAGQAEVEKGLHGSLKNCSRIIQQIKNRASDGKPVQKQLERLTLLLEDLEITDLLMQERHRLRSDKANSLGGKAVERQAAMAERYRQAMDELLRLLGQLQQDGVDDINLLERIETLLQQFTPQQQLPIHGVLPYRNLDYQAVTPVSTPTIVPAYQSGLLSYVSADLLGAPEAPVSTLIVDQAKAIAAAAGTQNWDPVAIYEWIKNNIETEWYFGAMKGAEGTLRQGSGNDADQAALLVALLRASNYPARYVRGVVEFFPGIDAVKSMTGIEDSVAIGEFFRKAGIPHQPVMDGLDIVNYQVEHVWVEALIPYANYRGAMADEQGKIWLPIDTSFKVAGYDEAGDLDIYNEVGNPLSTIRDDYLSTSQIDTPLDYLQSEVETFLTSIAPGTQYNSILHTRTLRDETLRILPSVPQFTEIAVTGEYTSLPAELIHTVNFQASTPAPESLPIFDINLPVYQLSNQQVVINFEPETVEDQEIINTWGGLDNTPGYLVRLRPVLEINDERIVVGQEGVAVGGQFDLTISLNSPAGNTSFTNTVIAGYPLVTGIVSQDAVVPDPADLQSEAIDLLYNEALNYIDRWNQGEDELAELLDLNTVHPLPTIATVGGAMEVVELLGEPQGITWKGLFLDADLRAVETAIRPQIADDRQRLFMQLAALEGSVLEGQIFKDAFDVESISTAKLFGLANDNLLTFKTINATNVDVEVPLLPFADNIKADITDAVGQGLTVQIPEQALTYFDWTGVGYIKEDLVTGAAGYMLSGAIAGGATVEIPDHWQSGWVDILKNFLSQEPNKNPDAGVALFKVSATDMQKVTAGKYSTYSLTALVRDSESTPVQGAPVTFTILDGGGHLLDETQDPPVAVSILTVTSDWRGMARAPFVAGQDTSVNTVSYFETGDQYATKASLQSVAASLGNGIDLLQPFMATVVPGEPSSMQSLTSGTSGSILQYSGSVGVLLQDQYGNPVANAPIKFATGSPTPYNGFCSSTDANQENLIAQLTTDWGCMDQLPAWGECAESNDVISLSASNGIAAAGVVLGSMPDGSYPVSASYDGPTLSSPLADRQFVSHSIGMLNGYCGGETPPLNYLTVQKEDYRVRPANSAVKVRVKTQMFAEGESITTGQENLTCGEDQYQCPQLQGDKSFDSSVPSSMSVLIDGQDTSTIQDAPGMYEAEVNLDLGSNALTVQANALKTINVFENDCANTGVCAAQPIEKEKAFRADWSVDYTGVAVQLDGPIHIPIDGNGYATSTTQISFDILPAGYDAVSSAFVLYENNNPIYGYETDTTGSPVAQVPMGFWFDESATYTARVILNNGWEDAQIDSALAEVKHGGFDLDVDSDNTNFILVDGAYSDPERDSLEEQLEDLTGGAGKVIRINSGDFDGDNELDFVEMVDANTMAAASPLHPMVLSVSSASYLFQAKIRFNFLESDLTNVFSSKQVNPGYLRVWTKDGTVDRSIASVTSGGDYVPAGAWLTSGQLTNAIDSLSWRFFVEGIGSSVTPGDVSVEVEVDPDGDGLPPFEIVDTVKFTLHESSLVTDYNHDRLITKEDLNNSIREKTFYFWTNNDDDSGELGGDDIPLDDDDGITGPGVVVARDSTESGYSTVDGNRDLIDFFPVLLDIKDLLNIFSPDTYEYRLSHKDAGVNLVYSDISGSVANVINVGVYHEDPNLLAFDVLGNQSPAKLGSARTYHVSNTGSVIENSFLDSLKLNDPKVLLVEGRPVTTNMPIVLDVFDPTGMKALSIPLNIQLDNVEQMFRHLNLNEASGGPSPGSQIDAGADNRFIEEGEEPSNLPDSESNNKYFVFIHGYNVTGESARGWHSEIFKRLYWAGSKARFLGVTWYGWEGQIPVVNTTLDYHSNVINALETARVLDQKLKDISGSGIVTVAGHSLGNMVVSSWLNNYYVPTEWLSPVENYFLINSAVAIESYFTSENGVQYQDINMVHYDWDGYEDFLWSTEWHDLFTNDIPHDNRSELTWRNVFGGLSDKGVNYVNFYSNSEDVLQELNYQSDLSTCLGGVGTYAWACQEKLKGMWIDGYGGSSYGGWLLNVDDYRDTFTMEIIGQDEANVLNPLDLKIKPFFLIRNRDSELLTPGANGSDYAANNMDRLLASAFPARTLPAGGKDGSTLGALPRFDVYDMPSIFPAKDSQDENIWPSEREQAWLHSDIREVSYPYLSLLFEEFVSKARLKDD